MIGSGVGFLNLRDFVRLVSCEVSTLELGFAARQGDRVRLSASLIATRQSLLIDARQSLLIAA
jgi:hypothetical protein